MWESHWIYLFFSLLSTQLLLCVSSEVETFWPGLVGQDRSFMLWFCFVFEVVMKSSGEELLDALGRVWRSLLFLSPVKWQRTAVLISDTVSSQDQKTNSLFLKKVKPLRKAAFFFYKWKILRLPVKNFGNICIPSFTLLVNISWASSLSQFPVIVRIFKKGGRWLN